MINPRHMIGDLHNRRIVASRMGNVEAVKKLFKDIAAFQREGRGGIPA
jgi:ribosomal protein L17